MRENQIIISILSNILPDFAEKQNQKLVDIQTRGGLTKVVDETQEMFILAEQLFRKTTKKEKHLKKIDINAMTEELLQDTKIISLYKASTGASIQMILIMKLKSTYWRISSNFIFVHVLFSLQKRSSPPTRNKNKKT